MGRHAELQRALARELRARGHVVLNKAGVAVDGPGWPDLLVWGEFTGGVEVKVGRDRMSGPQVTRARQLSEAGAVVVVVRELESGTVMVAEWRHDTGGGARAGAGCARMTVSGVVSAIVRGHGRAARGVVGD